MQNIRYLFPLCHFWIHLKLSIFWFLQIFWGFWAGNTKVGSIWVIISIQVWLLWFQESYHTLLLSPIGFLCFLSTFAPINILLHTKNLLEVLIFEKVQGKAGFCTWNMSKQIVHFSFLQRRHAAVLLWTRFQLSKMCLCCLLNISLCMRTCSNFVYQSASFC